MYRTNTFPLVHAGFFHAIMNVLALTPLLERFEAEYGTLTTLALFMGPLSTIPALLYTFIERGVLRGNTPILGASIWVFTLIAMEAVKQYKVNPTFAIGTTLIPTWITPIIMLLFVSFLIPNTSFLGHLCGLAFGYGCKHLIFSPCLSHSSTLLLNGVLKLTCYKGALGYLKFLAPPEWILRWIEGKLNLLGRLPHYVSVDQKTYGRFGVLPTNNSSAGSSSGGVELGYAGSSQRLGP